MLVFVWNPVFKIALMDEVKATTTTVNKSSPMVLMSLVRMKQCLTCEGTPRPCLEAGNIASGVMVYEEGSTFQRSF